MSYVSRFFDHPAGSYFLLGPRGTGKSTWLRARYPDTAWIDLLDAEAERNYYTRPERLKDFLRAQAGRRTIVIDEIQRVPQLLPLVHQHMERDKSTRFVLTGSSARKLRNSGVDLLAGRAVLCTMHPFMAAELGDAFDLDRSLESGMVPLVLTAEQPDRTLRGYVDLYLQQEVKAEGLVRRLDDFSRFLEVASFSHAQMLNVADIARECVAGRNTVESYLGILEDLLIATRLPVFRRRAKRAVVAHAKLYFFDCGCSARCARPGLSMRGRRLRGRPSKASSCSTCGRGSATAVPTAASTSGERGAGRRSTSSCTAPRVSTPSRSRTADPCVPATSGGCGRSTRTIPSRRRSSCTAATRPWNETVSGASRSTGSCAS